ncbi:MAG: coenzyme F420-0:L-glutamate ligase / coenzyme F420:gamma-L-glutamate ligase [Solirubrobacteraceae bacterium]|jgi:coenzyme F420-0:L-glutamate ligase/coenzyme F420-1:gamma-L-glutamate ligase|nr:coenzyme F420-0:L-glutamate ligase / coenzyme F420:gamma-L-glutamate ligase [Solirubrobacteraceae bacterium]
MTELHAWALPGLPEVRPGDDLGALLGAFELEPGDVLVVAHKLVSKAEGALRRLDEVTPSPRAVELAATLAKDPRQVQVVLDESAEVVRAQRGVLICRTHHGFVCANAGVDVSNAPDADTVVTLPRDPDASARSLRAALPARPAVVVADSFGRAWRHGQCDVAVGIAGLTALDDWRGRADSVGRELRATVIAVADQAAAAADLVRTKDSREPAVVVRGLERFVTAVDGPGAAALVRPLDEDLFT